MVSQVTTKRTTRNSSLLPGEVLFEALPDDQAGALAAFTLPQAFAFHRWAIRIFLCGKDQFIECGAHHSRS